MELQDLKDRWADYDRKLDASLRFNATRLRSSAMDKADTALRPLSFFLWCELVIDAILILAIGSFAAGHLGEIRFLAPAVALHVSAILAIVANAHQLVALRSIDLGEPIVMIQKKLGQVRIARIRITKWTILLAPLLWAPLLIVTMKGLLGVDAYRAFGAPWLIANVAVGVAFLLLMLWASRHWADRLQRSPFVQRLMDDIAGRSLMAATRFVSEVARFETD
jgi:hypothetical protein